MRAFPEPLVRLSAGLQKLHGELARFLRNRLYHHPRMRQEYARGESVIEALFSFYLDHPGQLPAGHAPEDAGGEEAKARAVADYIAGMTGPVRPAAFRGVAGMSRERLIVALDVPSPADALALVDRLGDAAVFYKIGMQLLSAGGYFRLVEELTRRGHKVVRRPQVLRRAGHRGGGECAACGTAESSS